MSETTEPTLAKPDTDAQREAIRNSLDGITTEIGVALRDAGHERIPVYLVVPNSGDALVTLATPLDDVPEADWQRITAIACGVIQDTIHCGRVRGRELACKAVNGAIASADVTSE